MTSSTWWISWTTWWISWSTWDINANSASSAATPDQPWLQTLPPPGGLVHLWLPPIWKIWLLKKEARKRRKFLRKRVSFYDLWRPFLSLYRVFEASSFLILVEKNMTTRSLLISTPIHNNCFLQQKKKWPPQLLLSLFLFFVAFVLYGKLKWKESQIVFLQDEKRSSDRNSVYSKDASGGGGNQHIESSLPSSPAPPPRPLSSISTGRIHKASDFHSIFLLASLEEKNHIANWTDIGPEFDLFFRKKCICEDGSSSLHNRRRQWNNGTSATAQKSSTLAKTQPQQVRLICNKERIFTTEAASIAASNAFLECRWAFAYFCYFYPQNQRIEQKKLQ